MAKPISVNIPHKLGKEEARRRIEEGFSSIQQQVTGGMFGIVSFQQRWEGDQMHFEGGVLHQRITGRLEVLPNCVQMQIDLPELLAALADRISARLRKETQKLLEKK
jgi:hypothetical protein